MSVADLRVELLYTLSCPHHERARADLQRILGEYAIETPIQLVPVERIEDAEFLAFAGSPTIRIDGVDLVPPAGDEPPGLGCRAYRQPDGSISWTVPEQSVRAAVGDRRRARFDAFVRSEASIRVGAPLAPEAGPDPGAATRPEAAPRAGASRNRRTLAAEDQPPHPDPDARPF